MKTLIFILVSLNVLQLVLNLLSLHIHYRKISTLNRKIASLNLALHLAKEEQKYISWNYLTETDLYIPDCGVEVLCYIPSWNEYKVCTVDDEGVWSDETGELLEANLPSKWMYL